MKTKTLKNKTLQEEFSALYEAESQNIFRFCFLRVSDREQALDLTQETFTRAWVTIQEGKTLVSGRAFLFTVAYRLIIDWYRKKKAVSLEGLSDRETDEPYEPFDENAMSQLELAAEGRFLLAAISKLHPSNRQAVYLRFIEGLSPPQVGEVLGISPNAASVRVNRGVEELRKITGYDIERK